MTDRPPIATRKMAFGTRSGAGLEIPGQFGGANNGAFNIVTSDVESLETARLTDIVNTISHASTKRAIPTDSPDEAEV